MDNRKILEDRAKSLRNNMIHEIAVQMQITDDITLNAMWNVPRHCFVPEEEIEKVYELNNVSIMPGVTLSYPEIVGPVVKT